MAGGGFGHWVPLLARFLTGQAAVQVVSLLTGFLILRLLSINEYAIYILATLIQGIGATGSDLGTSQGVISIGAPLREKKPDFASLLSAALRLRTRLFWMALPIMLVVGYFLLHGSAVPVDVAAILVGLTILNVWLQQSTLLATAVLNVNHDAGALFRSGMSAAIVRLALVVVACGFYPYAITALAVNLIGSFVQCHLLWRQCRPFRQAVPAAGTPYAEELVKFALPLLPSTIYYLCQSQISAFLLVFAGATAAVAEVGALGRLGQLVGLLALLNGFFVMPYFARISGQRIFARRVAEVTALAVALCGLLAVSALLVPQIWLAILGPNYASLGGEVILAVGGAALLVAGNVAYAIVMATRATTGQWIVIPLCVLGQAAYIFAVGVNTTREAMILNLIPIAVSCVFQYVVLGWITWWKSGALRGHA
jgi:O-antigen/teichoic acid export membrane protein